MTASNPPNRLRRPTLLTAALLLGSSVMWFSPFASATVDNRPVASGSVNIVDSPEVWSRDVDSDGSIDGSEISVLVWNVHKGSSMEWVGDFRSMSYSSDLVLLQEAHLREEFAAGLDNLPRWDMVDAWQYAGLPTGVLTASNAAPLRVRALEQREPLLRTDKSALLTEYRLAGSSLTLLVANVHAINFTADTRAFREQLVSVAELLDEHEGPLIFSGDLNTWHAGRRAIVDDIVASLGLSEVAFVGPRKTFGRFPLDHVFYRDLQLLAADVPVIGSSDHNPLVVRFRNPGLAVEPTLSSNRRGTMP